MHIYAIYIQRILTSIKDTNISKWLFTLIHLDFFVLMKMIAEMVLYTIWN